MLKVPVSSPTRTKPTLVSTPSALVQPASIPFPTIVSRKMKTTTIPATASPSSESAILSKSFTKSPSRSERFDSTQKIVARKPPGEAAEGGALQKARAGPS